MRRACALLFLAAGGAHATSAVMTPWSGSDGPFNVISLDGNTIYQAADTGGGVYAGFMYFRRPAGVTFTTGTTLYVEVDYKDIGGPGNFGMHYNSTYGDFQNCGFVFKTAVQNTSAYKTAVFRLDYAWLHLAQNGSNDLRLTKGGSNLRLHVKEMRISDQPGAAYLAEAAFAAPYGGPFYNNGTPVDAATMSGKTLCGYQGWFRTPGDDADTGWQHYIPNWGGAISPANIAMDYWPDMTEFTPAERHAANGFTHPDASQAELFSSLSMRTTLRHFQWMESWGIDGVALQRNHDDLVSPGSENLRHLTYVREAAHRTGRVWFVEYALKIPTTAADLDYLQKDWRYLVDVLQVTQDPAYLHHGGLPVAGVYGFFTSQIDTTATAHAVIDIFQNAGPYQAFVAGAGLWAWRTAFTPEWKGVIYRLGSYQPWNVGNGAGPTTFPNTGYWAADKAELDAQGVMYVPLVYPGGSADNRSGLPPGTTLNGRQQGAFIWNQFAAARSIGAQSVFLAMFDELDEGTQIIKSTNAPPTQAYFLGYEGLPSDCYLCFTAQGTRMIRGEIPYSAVKPDCAALTQPSIPDALNPADGSNAAGPNVALDWSLAFPAQGSGSPVAYYELDVDGILSATASLSGVRSLSSGSHSWRVRACNTLGNCSGWSLRPSFGVSGPLLSATPCFTATPSRTASPTPTPSPTRTPVPAAGCALQAEDYVAAYDTTAGNTGGQYRAGDVDIENCGDAGGGYNVGWTDNGEWLEFDILVTASGPHDFTLRTASANASGGTAQLYLDGAALGGAVSLPSTGGWQAYQDTTLPGLPLSAGVHRLRLFLLFGGSNYNYLCINPAPSPSGTMTPTASPTPSRSPTATISATLTPSPSPSGTMTVSDTPTISVTASRSLTSTPSPSESPSWTGSPTPSPTPTSTPSPSESPSWTPSPTPPDTPTATATPTPTIIESATASATPTPTPPAPAVSPSAIPAGPGRVVRALPLPNPNPRSLRVLVEGRVERLALKIYTQAFSLAAEASGGPAGPGWTSLALPAEFLGRGASATYFYRVSAGRDTRGASGVLLVVK